MTRQPRIEAIQGERRRRRADTLDGMENTRLALPHEFRDDKTHTYRWANDDGYRVTDLYNKDWDRVTSSKTVSAAEDELRRQVGVKKDGSPLFAILMRKPIKLHVEDRVAMVRSTEVREDHLATTPDTDPSSPDSASKTYVGKETTINRQRRGSYAP